jgi:hypothetical protein
MTFRSYGIFELQRCTREKCHLTTAYTVHELELSTSHVDVRIPKVIFSTVFQGVYMYMLFALTTNNIRVGRYNMFAAHPSPQLT